MIHYLQVRGVLPKLRLRDDNGRPLDTYEDQIASHRQGFESSIEAPDHDAFTLEDYAPSSSVAQLFYGFFRYYSFELDYNMSVISVRTGTVMTKKEKNWHLATNNRLCVEEPFNIDRNLGNTADDTAFRGLHLEFRRASELLAKTDEDYQALLAQAWIPYDFSEQAMKTRPQNTRPSHDSRIPLKPDESAASAHESSERLPQDRIVRNPISIREPDPPMSKRSSQSVRIARGAGNSRGGRNKNERTGPNVRRSSSAAAYNHNVYPMLAPTTIGYAQQWQPNPRTLPDDLARQRQVLLNKEQDLRARQQAIMSRAPLEERAILVSNSQPGTYGPGELGYRVLQNREQPASALPSLESVPRNQGLGLSPQRDRGVQMSQSVSQQGLDTNVHSPLLPADIPVRRSLQRTAPLSPGTLRSHSQPARMLGPGMVAAQGSRIQYPGFPPGYFQSPEPGSSPNMPQITFVPYMGPYGGYYPTASNLSDATPREYLGYGIGGIVEPPDVSLHSGYYTPGPFPGTPRSSTGREGTQEETPVSPRLEQKPQRVELSPKSTAKRPIPPSGWAQIGDNPSGFNAKGEWSIASQKHGMTPRQPTKDATKTLDWVSNVEPVTGFNPGSPNGNGWRNNPLPCDNIEPLIVNGSYSSRGSEQQSQQRSSGAEAALRMVDQPRARPTFFAEDSDVESVKMPPGSSRVSTEMQDRSKAASGQQSERPSGDENTFVAVGGQVSTSSSSTTSVRPEPVVSSTRFDSKDPQGLATPGLVAGKEPIPLSDRGASVSEEAKADHPERVNGHGELSAAAKMMPPPPPPPKSEPQAVQAGGITSTQSSNAGPSKGPSSSQWQQAGKKGGKKSRSGNSIGGSGDRKSRGEPLPANEAERKGG